jgi:hypothetical protein
MDISRIRTFRDFAILAAILLLQSTPIHGQTGRSGAGAFAEIKWDSYTFKFVKGNQMARVLDTNGQVIGTILSMNGELQILPTITGADAEKLKKSFQDWKRQGGEKALNGGAAQGSRSRSAGDGGTAGGGVPATRTASSATPARNTGDSSPASSASSTGAPATASRFKYGILDETGLDKLGHGAAIRLDLNLLRLSPELLDQKHYMQYFIGLNNCKDKNVAKMLNNELDYPDLVAFYQPKEHEILNSLTMSAGVALYAEAGLWKKVLTLGEYDKSKGSFPIQYAGQPDGAEVPATISYYFGKTEDRAACPIANQVLSSVVHGAMPSSYGISVKPMSFKEVRIDEAGARNYIQSVGGSQRVVVLLVDVHLLDAPPSVKKSGSTITAVNFTGEVGRVRVAKMNGDTVAVLFDNHTLPPP